MPCSSLEPGALSVGCGVPHFGCIQLCPRCTGDTPRPLGRCGFALGHSGFCCTASRNMAETTLPRVWAQPGGSQGNQFDQMDPILPGRSW